MILYTIVVSAALVGSASEQPKAVVSEEKIAIEAGGWYTTTRAVATAREEFESNRLLAAYRAGPHTSPEWDRQAEVSLRTAARWFFNISAMTNNRDLLRVATTAIEAGCKDPVVVGFAAIQKNILEDTEASRQQLRQALGSMMVAHAPPHWIARVAANLHESLDDAQQDKLIAEVRQIKLDHLRSTLRDGSWPPALLGERLQEVIDMRWEQWDSPQFIEFLRMVDQDPEIDQWTKCALIGTAEKEIAWIKRGFGVAAQTTQQQWAGFRDHAARAREQLERAYSIHPELPESCVEMIPLAMAGQAAEGEGIWFWFERVRKARFDYMPAYDRMRWALRPRWGGSYKEMLSYGMSCAASGRADTAVPWELIKVIRDIYSETEDFRPIFADPAVYATLSASLRATVSSPDNARRPDAIYGTLAGAAFVTGDYETSASLFRQSQSGKIAINPLALRSWTVDVNDLDAATFLAGPGKEIANEYHQAMWDEDWHKALALLEKTKPQMPDRRRGSADNALPKLTVPLQYITELEGGKGIRLDGREFLAGWRVVSGEILNSEGLIEVGTCKEPMVMYLTCPMPSRFEYSGMVDGTKLVAHAKAAEDTIASVLFAFTDMGRLDEDAPTHRSARLEINLARKTARLCGAVEDSPDHEVPGLEGKANFRIQLWDGFTRITVNDAEVYKGPVKFKRRDLEPGRRIGLAWYGTPGGKESPSIVFQDLRVEPLSRPPEGAMEHDAPGQDINKPRRPRF